MTGFYSGFPASSQLVGRSAELQALRQLLASVSGGQGRVAFIVGEAGIGKSRLTSEIATEAVEQGFLRLQGTCSPSDFNSPYAPLIDLLRNLPPGHMAQDGAAFASREGERLFSTLRASLSTHDFADLKQEKRHLFDRLAQYLLRLAAQQPLVLVVEDLHWADEVSLEFLHYFAKSNPQQPILLLLTYRHNEIRPEVRYWLARFDRERIALEIFLRRLTPGEASALLRAILPAAHAVAAELSGAIYTLTEGNPFFIEELLKSLAMAGELSELEGAWHWQPGNRLPIPRTVQDVVHQRSDQLSEPARRVATVAAVMGRRFGFDLLQQLTEFSETDLLQCLKELIAAQLVVEQSHDHFAFRHALTREAIYNPLLVRERNRLHRRIAEILEAQADESSLDVEDLAYHFYEANDWGKALHYCTLAGERAQSLYSPQAAIRHFSRAMDATQQLAMQTPVQLYRIRGLAYEATGQFKQALADLEQALAEARTANDRALEWQLLLDLGMLWAGQDYEKTGPYYRQAFELARAMGDPRALARSLNSVGNWHLNIEQPVEAHWYHQGALRIFESLDDTGGVAETLDLLGMASVLGGNLVQGARYYAQAVVLFQRLEARRGLSSSLTTLTMRGPTYQTDTLVAASSLPDAALDGDRALTIARETGQRADEAYAMIMLAICLGSAGEYQRAFPLVQEALAVAVEIEHRQWITAAHVALGALALDILALDLAQQQLEKALALAQASRSLHWVRNSAGFLAATYALQRQFDRAGALLSSMVDPSVAVRTLGQRLLARAQIELALAQDQGEAAFDAVEKLAHETSNDQSARLLMQRGESLLLLKRYAEAEFSLQTAQELAAMHQARPLLWRIHGVLARLYRAQKRSTEADQTVKQSQALIEALATNIPDPALQRLFRQQATILVQPPPSSPAHVLTPREREVAALLAEGKSNRQIAEALVLGERTVETHVGHILGKLGFTSRAQVVLWVIDQGQTPDTH